jgi:hypothetical protein
MENNGLNFVKTDEEVFYFNYKSMPDQVIELDCICGSCDEDVSDSNLAEGDICPYCEEEIVYTSREAWEFFETDQPDDEIAGYLYNTHNRTGNKATITIQGIINFDTDTARIVEYDKTGTGRLLEEKSTKDVGLSPFVDIDEVKTRLDLFTQTWGVKWEASQLMDNELNEVN